MILLDFSDSMILLGSVKRFELQRVLWLHMSQDQKVVLPEDEAAGDHSASSSPGSSRVPSRAPTPPPRIQIIPNTPVGGGTKPRFMVSKVDETQKESQKSSRPSVRSMTRSVSSYIS